MSLFAFYDHTSDNRRLAARIAVPAQRVLRRMLRPAFYRLRDLLQHLFDRQCVQENATAHLAGKLADLEAAHTRLAYAHKALIQDQLAVSRRVVMLEDLILQLTESRQDDARILPLSGATLLRKAC